MNTPKPWKVYSDATKTFVASSSAGRVVAADLYDESTDTPIEEIEANARLIAAAPELLEALEDVQEWIATGKVDGVGFDEMSICDLLHETIAKAKGGIMTKQDYTVTLHDDRSCYGVELDISVPQNDNPVVVAQDVYGEKQELMQLLVYPATDEEGEVEAAVSIRFNNDGSIAGVVVPDGIPVSGWEESAVSEWMEARDGK